MQMAGPLPGIIGDINIALFHIGTADCGDEMPDRIRHRIDMTRCAGNRLGQHLAGFVIDTGRQIACFPHRG